MPTGATTGCDEQLLTEAVAMSAAHAWENCRLPII
jgi:hypothetical protein